MNSDTVKVKLHSEWKYEAGCLPTRVIIWQKNDSFVTHLEVKKETGEKYFVLGHYDMTMPGAVKDFGERCQSLGVTELECVCGG